MNRELNNFLRWILENLLPPVIRDSRWFMAVPLRIYFGRDWRRFERFRADAVRMSSEDFARLYAEIRLPSILIRPTDCNDATIRQILADVAACTRVLDAGCGRGYLAGQMATVVPEVTGVDVHIPPNVPAQYPKVTFQSSDVAGLPFPDKSFDAVVATHTLEHVADIAASMNELRRVARSLLIVVVPKERPYRSTLNLHLHSFPYVETFLLAIHAGRRQYDCFEIGGDIYYRERLDPSWH